MESVIRDVLFAFRSLRRHPAFAITAVLTIALGIGATSAIFSVVNAVLLRPLPYNDAARLGTVWSDLRNRNVKDFPLPPGDFFDMRKDTTSFDGFAAITSFRPTVGGDGLGEAEQVSGGAVTTNFFSLLGHKIQVGRDFADADGTPQPPPPTPVGDALPPPGAQPPPPLPNIAIISHEFFQRRFGGNASIVGQSIPFGGNGRAEIVGVLAPGFEILFPPGTNVDPRPDILIASRVNFETGSRNNVSLRVVAKLKPGVSFNQAQQELDRLSADLRKWGWRGRAGDRPDRSCARCMGPLRPFWCRRPSSRSPTTAASWPAQARGPHRWTRSQAGTPADGAASTRPPYAASSRAV